jgi:O-antigen ligase
MLPFWKLVFLISPVITLVLPSGYFVGPFLMAWAGLFYRRQAADQSPIAVGPIKTSWVWMLGGFGVLIVTGVSSAIAHSNHAGHYEMYVPFVLFPGIALLIRAGKWQAEPWLISVAIGALLAFAFAVYQVFEQNIGRATGSVNHPIPFGNTAIVLGAVALVAGSMFPFDGDRARWKRWFLLFAGTAGAGASLLSGSKGGWLSLFIIGLTVAYLTTHQWPMLRRHFAALAVIASLVIAGLLAPSHVVKDRVESGLKGGWHWVQTGEVTEGSVSMRFEIWKLSLRMIAEEPWLGHGSVGARERWHVLLNEGKAHQSLVDLVKANPKFSTADNEMLGALKGGGLLGMLGLLAGYVGVWMAFWLWRRHEDAQIKTLSTIGLLLVLMYLEFGLTVSVFGINVFRSVFVTLAVVLLAFITVRSQFLKERP